MSNPQPERLKPEPPRAEPLQPDAPAKGNDKERTTGDEGTNARSARDKATEQARTARKNVSDGYGS